MLKNDAIHHLPREYCSRGGQRSGDLDLNEGKNYAASQSWMREAPPYKSLFALDKIEYDAVEDRIVDRKRAAQKSLEDNGGKAS
jgi:hypothetical protein